MATESVFVLRTAVGGPTRHASAAPRQTMEVDTMLQLFPDGRTETMTILKPWGCGALAPSESGWLAS